jgi:hypothetical protein
VCIDMNNHLLYSIPFSYVTDMHTEIEVTVLDDDDKQFLGKERTNFM